MQSAYQAAKELQQKLHIDDLLLPVDHLATRVYSQNREVAILEYLSWGSFFWAPTIFGIKILLPTSPKVRMAMLRVAIQPGFLQLVTRPILLIIGEIAITNRDLCAQLWTTSA